MFSKNNTKLKHCSKMYDIKIVSFDINAGITCPAASLCHSQVEVVNGKRKIVDYGQFRCYAASSEATYTSVFNMRLRNLELSKSDNFVDAVSNKLVKDKIESLRIHSSGDFYSPEYMRLWIQIARKNPSVHFWGYTKMGTYIKFLNAQPNMSFVYSMGGLFDTYAKKNNLASCYVITEPEQAVELGVDIACTPAHKSNDYEYIKRGESFALLIHGTQKAGSKKMKIKTY